MKLDRVTMVLVVLLLSWTTHNAVADEALTCADLTPESFSASELMAMETNAPILHG